MSQNINENTTTACIIRHKTTTYHYVIWAVHVSHSKLYFLYSVNSILAAVGYSGQQILNSAIWQGNRTHKGIHIHLVLPPDGGLVKWL